MNALPTTLQRVSHTRFFAIAAIAFFILISALIVMLFSRFSVTPSFEDLQALVVKNHAMQTDVSVPPTTNDRAVLGATSTVSALYFETPTQSVPRSYSYDIQKSLAALQKSQQNTPAFIMKTEEVEAFMVFITGKLNLTEAQSGTVIRDINTMLETVNAEYVRLSMVDRRTLDQLFPFSQTPRPRQLTRLFFYIQSAQKSTTAPVPQPTPYAQTGSLELGAISTP